MIKKYLKPLVYLIVGIFGIFLFLIIFSNLYILRFNKYVVSPFDVPTTTIGLIFGGGARDDGTLNPMAGDRVIAGIALYKTGKVQKLMMTGDDGQMRSDEIGAMKNTALAYGIPSSDVLADPHGYRTYESCFREAKIYDINKAVVVSQKFHLPRIIYLCRSLGIDTVGIASDYREYSAKDRYYMSIREIGARLKAWWQISISKPLPRNLTKV